MTDLSHRKSSVQLCFQDPAGKPLKGQTVECELTRHEFLFGCGAFFTIPLLDPATLPQHRELLEKYWDAWRKVCNYGTLPFYQGRYEPAEGKTREAETLRAAKFLHNEGITLKGHPLCWHTVSAKWLKEKADDEVLANQIARIHREINAFREYITLWDVINEVVIMPVFEKEENAITRLCAKIGRVELVKKVFEAARDADPNATLLLNDFNTSEQYRQLIEDCLSAGIPIDVIGIQSHQHQGFWGNEKLHEVLERFSSFGKTIHFTENTFVSGDLMPAHIVDLNDWQVPSWPTTAAGEDRQARDLLNMLDTLFAHPLVEAFTTWDFNDGEWLGAPSGLVRKDGSLKPAYEALYQRIHHDWHTKVTLVTDEKGQCILEGFRGVYSLKTAGHEISYTLCRDKKSAQIVV